MNSEDDQLQFDLMGGEHMKKFVERTLVNERSRTATSKKVKEPINVDLNDPTVKAQTGHVELTEDEDVGDNGDDEEVGDDEDNGEDEEVGDDEDNGEEGKMQLNALVLIFDNDMRVLIIKRSSYPDQWQPNKWSLVGGMVEDGEDPLVAAKREAFEETGIKLDNIKEKFVIQRDETNVEHLFVGKLPNRYDTYNVTLDKENDGYGWFKGDELNGLDGVPNLKDYIRIAITKYDD
jgi:8-oxo-dGTP pyrophosphatase MutT (NUDIX family)